jgi:hypothetical protein
MRKYGKTDNKQPDIVSALREIGASVQLLASVGGGCPDLLVGWHGRNILIEVKDSPKAEFTAAQIIWWNDWRGQKARAENIEQAIAELNKAVRR